jgi:hypothetical protein
MMRRRADSGGAAARVIAGLAVAVALLLGTLAAAAWYLASNVRVSRKAGGETSVETPFGSVRVRENAKLDPKALGVPVYPGAERVRDSRKLASFELEWDDARKEITAAVAEYITTDRLEKVEEFYRETLPAAKVKGNRKRIVFQTSDRGVRTVVALRDRGGETYISLASFTDAAAN